MIEVLLVFILIFLILAVVLMISILWNIVDLGVDIQTDISHLRLTLYEIKRINENIYFKVDKFKEEDDCK